MLDGIQIPRIFEYFRSSRISSFLLHESGRVTDPGVVILLKSFRVELVRIIVGPACETPRRSQV